MKRDADFAAPFQSGSALLPWRSEIGTELNRQGIHLSGADSCPNKPGHLSLRLTPLGLFKIIRPMPSEQGIQQYRIKSIKDGHERVAMECDLT